MAVTSRITMQTTGSVSPAGRRWNRASVPAMQRRLQTDTMVRRPRIVASSAAQDAVRLHVHDSPSACVHGQSGI